MPQPYIYRMEVCECFRDELLFPVKVLSIVFPNVSTLSESREEMCNGMMIPSSYTAYTSLMILLYM
jgi:hypothetical protein